MENNQQERTVDVVCPWCDSEIVWDEELGPEEHCPHCSNELGRYRTVGLGGEAADEDEDEEAEYEEARRAIERNERVTNSPSNMEAEAEWEDEDAGDDTGWAGAGRPQTWLRADEKVQRILDDQEEMPECPACREFMMHGGTSLLGPGNFEAVEPPSLKRQLLPSSIKLQLYVCPKCHEVSTKLDFSSRAYMTEALDSEN
ncbi:hypothetical protein SAMN05444162_0808 [Paenibacillaceae bacterium GAS479]|nr:hypothetical protein SAMN05444162_0808 [Paenibacillaceae bacterium GAS479]